MPTPSPSKILIIGTGPSGLASALSLTSLTPPIPFTLYELRPFLSSIGGAVGLTPNALRYLDRLGVLSKLKEQKLGGPTSGIEIFSMHSGWRMGEIDFRNVPDGFEGRRVMRADLLKGMLEVLEERMQRTGVGRVVYGKRVVGLVERQEEGYVLVEFEDGTTDTGDLVLGCDGIHSATRMSFVESERKPVYSGIAAAYGIANAESLTSELHFQTGAVNSSRQGSLLTAFCDEERKKMYVAAIMETEEQFSREGWKAKGADLEGVRKYIMRRFEGGCFPIVEECVEKTEDWFLYPVYKLSPKGRWCKGRVMLLGDAAHAVSTTLVLDEVVCMADETGPKMPPQGESVGLALEDVVLFMRIFSHYEDKSIPEIFEVYESFRRKRIDDAYNEANYRWETVKDAGWLGNRIKELFTPLYLWWTKDKRAQSFKFDVGSMELPA
jgi:salicylate hydroxylase